MALVVINEYGFVDDAPDDIIVLNWHEIIDAADGLHHLDNAEIRERAEPLRDLVQRLRSAGYQNESNDLEAFINDEFYER